RKFLEARAKVDREREYPPAEAIALVKESKRANFDESVEVHIRTGLNVRHADEQLRGTVALPNGLGRDVTAAVFAKGAKAREGEVLQNYAALLEEIIRAKPSGAKGRYIKSITLASTMGPGVKVDPSRTRPDAEAPVAANA